jgi:hypothetical protein
LECGGLTPLWTAFQFETFLSKLPAPKAGESGVKPPHSEELTLGLTHKLIVRWV